VAEGLGLRGTSRVLEIKLDTIRKWLALAALHCEQVSDMLLRDLKLSQVQVDELWTFVKKNTKIPLDRQPPSPASFPKRARTKSENDLGLAGLCSGVLSPLGLLGGEPHPL